MLELILSAAGLFIVTNIDDMFLLIGFFSQRSFRPREIILGQSIGISVLFLVSAVASLISLVLSRALTGFLGFAPIFIGVKSLYSELREPKNDSETPANDQSLKFGRTAAVALVTLSNGGDNIAIYTSSFSMFEPAKLAIVGLVFLLMTALWCASAFMLVSHPQVGSVTKRIADKAVPIVLIILGFVILLQAGTVDLIRNWLDSKLL